MTAHFRASIFRLFRLPLSTVWKSSRTGHQPYMDQMPSVVSPTSSCAGTLMAFGHPRESPAQPTGAIYSSNMAWSQIRGGRAVAGAEYSLKAPKHGLIAGGL